MRGTMTITNKEIYQIYSRSYSITESRGKERQNTINDTIINILTKKEEYKDCDFKTETRMYEDISWGQYFTVDIQVWKDGKLIEIILAKAPASNIVQNHVNGLNSRAGELLRLGKYGLKGVKITFFTFQPNKCPYFTSNGLIKHFENTTVEGISEVREFITFDFRQVTVTFDINGIEKCSNREDVKKILMNEEVINNIQVHI